MIEREVARGWKLVTWTDWVGPGEPRPSLDGGDFGAELNADDEVEVTNYREEVRTFVPAAALRELLEADDAWKGRTAK